MKKLSTLLLTFIIVIAALSITACENTHVSGSVSYGMGYGSGYGSGYGYPMYYGNSYRSHSNIVVVRPTKNSRTRPSRAKRR